MTHCFTYAILDQEVLAIEPSDLDHQDVFDLMTNTDHQLFATLKGAQDAAVAHWADQREYAALATAAAMGEATVDWQEESGCWFVQVEGEPMLVVRQLEIKE